MSETAISLQSLGKLYKLYARPLHRLIDAFGLTSLPFLTIPPPQHFWALRDLTLTVPRGRRLGIIGRNGAGKSTLLKIIAGTLPPSEGTVRVDGKVQALLELGTGFHPEFTGRQNIRTYLAYQGLSSRQIALKEPEIVDFAELDDFIERPVKTYSAGMYARLAFSAATAVEPDVLIVDEVLSTGDAYFAGKCIERMKRLTRDSAATVIFVSHDLSSVQHLCDRVIWIDRGRIAADGEPLDVVKAYSAAVRADEDVRLRARDLRILKSQAASLDLLSDVYDKRLFHLVPTNGSPHPSSPHKIYSITLTSTQDVVARIDVGAPLDNSPDHLHYLLDNPAYMDWSQPAADSRGSFRFYADCSGRYAHAPFELAVPKTFLSLPLTLEIAHSGKEPVKVELHEKGGYRTLGLLPAGDSTQSFCIEPPTGDGQNHDATPDTADTPPPPPRSHHEYGSGGVRITRVAILDHQSHETKVLTTGFPAKVLIEYSADREITDPIFAFCVYLADGRCATQFLAPSSQLGRASISGSGVLAIGIDTLHLGRGAYIASAAIFNNLRHDGIEPESYHMLDRCIHFQVVQPPDEPYELGLCLQHFEATLDDA